MDRHYNDVTLFQVLSLHPQSNYCAVHLERIRNLNHCVAVSRKFANIPVVKKKILLMALLSEENFANTKK